MLPAMTLLAALSVPALLVLREMESTVQVRLVELPPQCCVEHRLYVYNQKYKLRFHFNLMCSHILFLRHCYVLI